MGLVSITGCCNSIEPYNACIIGIISGFVYFFGLKILEKFKIDDPIESSIVHGFGGIWGVLAVGFFDRETGVFYSGNFK